MDIPFLPRTAALALPLVAILSIPGIASADRARVQSLGGIDLLIEDNSDIFLNPAHIGAYSNRAWFSLGVTGSGGTVGFDPHGGGAVRIRDVFNLGVVLNRSPQAYGFGNAIWPVANVYIPGGPGGTLSGPDGPSEPTAPLRFPVDLFVGYGNKDTGVRVGANFYYAGGAQRVWEVEDSDQDGNENSGVTRLQSHLFNATVGVAVGRTTDRVRPEGWFRVGNLAAWADEQSFRGTATGEDPVVDRILSMDRDLRIGFGARVPIGDATALRGVVVTPALSYDVAMGSFRFDDNLVNPDSDAEQAQRAATAHDLRVGVGVAGRADDLLVVGTASVVAKILSVKDTLIDDDTLGTIDQFTNEAVDLALPELSIGAEYRVLPVLIVRAGVRSTVGGGRQILTAKSFNGPEADLFQLDVNQTIIPQDLTVAFEANGGLGLHVRRFALDATFGGLFLGQAGSSFFSRVDLSFNFD